MSAAHNLPAPTSESTIPTAAPSGRDQTSSTDHGATDTQRIRVGAASSTGTDQNLADTQDRHVGSGPFSAPAATRTDATPMALPSRRDADPTLEVES